MILQGYHLSGLARQMFWRAYQQHPLAQTYAALAVQHLVTYYQKTSPQKKDTARGNLCVAIMLAVDSGMFHSVQILKLNRQVARSYSVSMHYKLIQTLMK